MKSSRLLLFFIAINSGVPGAQVAMGQAQEPAVRGAVTLTGAVIAEGTRLPVPYTSVKLQPPGRERFADRNGAFVYYAVAPGPYQLQVRMLGYLPIDSAIHVVPNVPLSITVTLERIPTSLDAMQVTAPPRMCIFPDEMGAVSDPELATVLGEARKNAQREQLLRRTYPFEYRLAQSHETHDVATKSSSLRYDTVTFRSDDTWRYRKGRVVTDERNKLFGDVRLMRLPTLADLADRNFLNAHCFKYAGIVDEKGKPAHRIDFHSDSTLLKPDVEGSIFLDSATYLIRRAQFRLTRGNSVKPPILGMEVTTTYREILPNVALFDEIHSVQPHSVGASGGSRVEFREVQKLLEYRFLYGGPPGTIGHKWISARVPGRGDSVFTTTRGPPP